MINSTNTNSQKMGFQKEMPFFRSLLIPVLVLVTLTIQAQHELSMYNFKGVAQSSLLNPATRTDQRFTLSFANVGMGFNNTPFSPYDLLAEGTVFNDNVSAVLGDMRKSDYMRLSTNIDVLFLSFNVNKKIQLSMGLSQTNQLFMNYPVDLLRLAQGNYQFINQTAEFGGWGFESTLYGTVHVGGSYKYNEKLTLGARAKMHVGMGNVFIDRDENQLDVFFGESEWTLTSNSMVRTSGVYGMTEGEGFNLAGFRENRGYSFDLGFEYELNSKWSFYGSILDLGGITWRNDLREYVSQGEFEFDGFEYDINDGGSVDVGELTDSLMSAFDFDEREGDAYRRAFSTQVFVGSDYKLTEKHVLTGIMQFTGWSSNLYANMHLRYTFKPTRFVHLMASANTFQGRIYSMGGGLQLYAPGLQVFLLSDYISNAFDLYKSQGMNLRVGVNIALWDRSDKKKKKKEQETIPPPLPAEDQNEEVD